MIRRPGGRGAPAARPVRPSALRPGARPGGGVRRTRSIRRASAGLTPVRAGALLALLAGVAVVYGLASSDAFAVRRTTVTGATWTGEERIIRTLAIPEGANVFTIRTSDLEASLAAIPAVASARVTIALPDEVRVAVTEREALLLWRVGSHRFLADGDGRLFAELGDAAPDAADAPPDATAALPLVDDARMASMAFEVGSVLDPVTLDAALRLGSLTPADVGSGARALALGVDDDNGFTMRTRPASWTAVFGFYTPTLRTTDLVPGQVRLLRSILAGREDSLARVELADGKSGTMEPRLTPKPAKSPRPGKTASPAGTPKPAKSPRPSAAPGASPTP